MIMKKFLLLILLTQGMLSCKQDDELERRAYQSWQDFYSPPHSETYLSSLALDEQENVWMSCHYDTCSLRKFDGTTWTYYNKTNDSLLDQSFSLIYQNEERKLWQGQGIIIDYNTAVRYDNASYRYWSVHSTNTPHKSLEIQADNQGNLWDASSLKTSYPFGSDPPGLRKFDGEKWTIYDTENSPLPTNHIAYVCFDQAGNLLVSTLPARDAKGVVMKFDGQNWETMYVCSEAGHWIAAMAVDRLGTLWLGELYRETIGNEYGGGLLRYDGKQWKNYTIENSGLPSNSVVELWLDQEDNLWVGAYNGGLSRFDKKETWKVINQENSPMPFTSSIEHIRSDKEGQVWFAVQSHGLAMIRP